MVRRLKTLLWVGVLCSALAGVPLRAQESAATPTPTPDPKQPIKMVLASPLAKVEKPLMVQTGWQAWVPVQITLSNVGDPVSGRLTMRLFNLHEPAVRASQTYTDIDLPTTSNKQIWLYARAENTNLNAGEITFSGRGFRQVRVPFELDMRDEGGGMRMILSVSANGEKINGLLGAQKPLGLGIMPEIVAYQRQIAQSTAQFRGELVRPLGTTHKDLPSRWAGLQAANAVILQDFPFAELTTTQLDTLRGYVATGGALIVVGGANWDRLAKSPLADLWPVTPTGAAPATAEQRNAFFRRYVGKNMRDLKNRQLGDDLTGAPLMLTQATLKPGAQTIWGTSSPIMAVRNYGAGQVIFLACDPNAPPFLGWRGIPYFWKEVFDSTQAPVVLDSANPAVLEDYGSNPMMGGRMRYGYGYENESANPTWQILEDLRRVRQLKTPPVSTIAWFLALYVFFLVPVNYCLLRLFDKRELAWVTVPVIVIAFSVMSYAAALRIKGSTLLARQANIVQGSGSLNSAPSGDLWARSDSMLWLFSPRKTSYEITGEDPRLVVADYIQTSDDINGRVTIAQAADDKPFKVEDAAVNMWAWRAFVGHTTVNVKGGLQVQTTSGKPVVKNASPFPLRGVVVKWNSRLWACGDIKPGATMTGEPSGRADATGAQLASPIRSASSLDRIFPQSGSSMQQAALNSLNLALSSPAGSADALAVGWSVQPVAGLTILDSSPAFENATLFLFRLD